MCVYLGNNYVNGFSSLGSALLHSSSQASKLALLIPVWCISASCTLLEFVSVGNVKKNKKKGTTNK